MLARLVQTAAVAVAVAGTTPAPSGSTATVAFRNAVEDGRDFAGFESRAPLQTIHGSTHAVHAEIHADPEDVSRSRVQVDVELATLRTGIDSRDGNLRDTFLETDRWPRATFTSRTVACDRRTVRDGETVELRATGDFAVHGVTRTLTIPVSVTYLRETDETRKERRPGDVLHAAAEFWISLREFQIEVPKWLVLKLSDRVKCSLDVVCFSGHRPAVAAPSPQIGDGR